MRDPENSNDPAFSWDFGAFLDAGSVGLRPVRHDDLNLAAQNTLALQPLYFIC